MIREIISNDSLTLILFGSFFLLIILKKIDSNIFYQNLSFFQRDSRNSFSNNLIGIKFPEIIYNILFISNLSLLLTFADLVVAVAIEAFLAHRYDAAFLP